MATHVSSGAGDEVGLGTSSLAGGCCTGSHNAPVSSGSEAGPDSMWTSGLAGASRASTSISSLAGASTSISGCADLSHTSSSTYGRAGARVSGGPGGCSEALLWGAGTGVGPCLAAAAPTHGVGMGAVAGCILPGLTLVVRMGARTVWTSSTPSLSGNAGGGGSSAGQNPIRAARFSILCLPRSIRSGSSSCWQRDTAGCSSAMPPAGFRHYFK